MDVAGAEPQFRLRAAHLAAAWAFVFAAISFYWAVGGTLGLDTLSREIEADARAQDSAMLAVVWLTGILKLGAGLLALALVVRWGARLPARPLRWGAWVVGIGFALYGAASTVEKALMKAGAIDVPASLGEDRVDGYLFGWDPFWLLGGILFILAARRGVLHAREPSSS